MKIQCSCGAKYEFDVTPENLTSPVRFVCPACGVDSSEAVNELIRRQFGESTPSAATASPSLVPPVPVAHAPGLRISRGEPPVTATGAVESAAVPSAAICAKHNEPATEQCAVCHKPICPKCMELFGYFCSPFCKSKAEARSLQVPVYAGLGSNVEARFWRKTGWIIKGGLAVVLLGVGLAVWYNFFAALPHPVFSVHFDQRAEAGQSMPVAPDQLVFLHGGTLARYDLKSKKEIWSQELITDKEVDDLTARLVQAEAGEMYRSLPDQLAKEARAALERRLTLLGAGQNVWVATRQKMSRYDWDTGRVLQTLSLGDRAGAMMAGDGELLMLREDDSGAKTMTHVSYATGELRSEEFQASGKIIEASGGDADSGGGLPSATGNPNQPLDPAKVAEQAQNLTTPARLALPALIANNLHQLQIMKEIHDGETPAARHPAGANDAPRESFTLVPGKFGYVSYTVKLLEENIITRDAMKAPPQKKVLDGDLTAGQGPDAVNELLNEQQRASGGGKVQEDASRYQVTVRVPGGAGIPDWTGEVIGPPVVYAQKTVNVVAAGKSVTVLDKADKKLWDASLLYTIPPSRTGPDGEDSVLGAGPCVEHGDTLYVYDQAVLTAFDLATGNARWRLPSVGIVGLYFDDQDHVYVNTTTANPDKIKYSKEIDIAESIDALVLKVDGRTGRNLWTVKTGGFVAYVAGPFVYTLQSHDTPENDNANDLTSVLQKPSIMKLVRLNPSNGRTLWEHDEDRAPLDVRFDRNTIYLVFHREVQVLKYLTL